MMFFETHMMGLKTFLSGFRLGLNNLGVIKILFCINFAMRFKRQVLWQMQIIIIKKNWRKQINEF